MSPEELYLDLLKRCLTRSTFGGDLHMLQPAASTLIGKAYLPFQRGLERFGLRLVRRVSEERVQAGGIWPLSAETMLSPARLDNIQEAVTTAVRVLPEDYQANWALHRALTEAGKVPEARRQGAMTPRTRFEFQASGDS